jgi:hypothetical protein
MFLDHLSRRDVEDLDELSFQGGEIQVPDSEQGWRAIASLAEQRYFREEFAGNFDFHYKIIRVSDSRSGQGRFQLDGLVAGEQTTIWDDVECVQGSENGLYVYARGKGRGFYLDWIAESNGWQYRGGRLGLPYPKREGPLYSKIRLFRFRSPAAPRERVSALAA